MHRVKIKNSDHILARQFVQPQTEIKKQEKDVLNKFVIDEREHPRDDDMILVTPFLMKAECFKFWRRNRQLKRLLDLI